MVILLTFLSCETIEIPGKPASEYEKIYMPTAVNYPNEKGLAYSNSVQLIVAVQKVKIIIFCYSERSEESHC